MAVEITPLGFRKPNGKELLRNVDNEISHNAQKAEDYLGQLLPDVEALKTLGGLVPGDVSDATMTTLANDPNSDFSTALSATFASRTAAALRVAFEPPAAADNPSVTLIARAQSTLVGDLIRETRKAGTSYEIVDQENDPAFRWDGSPEIKRLFNDPPNYVEPVKITEASTQPAYHNYSFETVTGPDNKELEVLLRGATSTVLRIYVDGKPTSINALFFGGLTAGSGYNLRLVFPTAKARTIKVMFGDNTAFGGVRVLTGETLTRPTIPVRLRVAVIGDSYEGGTDIPPNGGTRLDTGGFLAATMLGADSIWNYGIGGTGYVATTTPYGTRSTSVVAADPDIAIVSGSINDGTADTVELRTAVDGVLSALASVPEVYVTGPSKDATYEPNNTAVRERTEAAGRVYIDPLNPRWLDASLIGSDGAHPTWEGHQRRGVRIYQGIDAAREFLGYQGMQSVTVPPAPEPTIGVVVADTFTRADSTNLGTTETGALAWTETGRDWSISGNQLVAAAGTVSGRVLVATGQTGPQIIRAVFASAPTVASAMVAFAAADLNAGYALNRDGAGVFTLRKIHTGGSMSVLATISGPTAAAGNAVELEFAATNSTIVARVDGFEASVNDSSTRSGGAHGFWAWANHAAAYDSFEVETTA